MAMGMLGCWKGELQKKITGADVRVPTRTTYLPYLYLHPAYIGTKYLT